MAPNRDTIFRVPTCSAGQLHAVPSFVFVRLQAITQLGQLPPQAPLFLGAQSRVRQELKYVIVGPPRCLDIATHRLRFAACRLIEMPARGCQLR